MVWSGISTNTITPVTSFSVDTREYGHNGNMESLKNRKKVTSSVVIAWSTLTTQVF